MNREIRVAQKADPRAVILGWLDSFGKKLTKSASCACPQCVSSYQNWNESGSSLGLVAVRNLR